MLVFRVEVIGTRLQRLGHARTTQRGLPFKNKTAVKTGHHGARVGRGLIQQGEVIQLIGDRSVLHCRSEKARYPALGHGQPRFSVEALAGDPNGVALKVRKLRGKDWLDPQPFLTTSIAGSNLRHFLVVVADIICQRLKLLYINTYLPCLA